MDHISDEMRQLLQHTGDEPHLFREVTRTQQALMGLFSQKVGMPGSRLALLRELVANLPREMGVLDIARSLSVDPAAITRQVKDLERRGLVERVANTMDRRRSAIRLTEQGMALFVAAHERSHELERMLEAAVAPEEIRSAAVTLARVRGAVEGLLEGGRG